MDSSDNYLIQNSGKLIAKNTIYNLLGYGIPLLIAIVLIPPLIKGLGEERFGILNLTWIVIGYFSFFDFGIGRSLTKVVAEKIGLNQKQNIPQLFWTSLFLMLLVSFLASGILIFTVPWLVNEVFKISIGMRQETIDTFYLLTIAIPLVSTTAGLRGVLEAYQKFGVINVMRVFLGIFTFLGPLLVLIFSDSLFWIVVFLIFIRIIIWFLYLAQCLKINPDIKKNIKIDLIMIRPVLKLSLWISVANIVGPVISYADRFLIGTLISATAITYYATPFEVVTKLLLIPSALVVVLFPIFSASFINNFEFSKKIFQSGVKFTLLILYPIVLLLVTFAFEGMDLWLGKKFADSSSLILQLLAIGVLLNGIAFIPFNFFQGIAKPKIPALLNLVELPFYILIMWFVIQKWGINGAAIVWLARIVIDTSILFSISYIKFDIKFESVFSTAAFFLLMATLVIPFFMNAIIIKIIFTGIVITIFCVVSWKFFLLQDEKRFLLSKLKPDALTSKT